MSKVNNSEYFEELKEWSRRKHSILTRYVGGAARILRTVYYLDAFAGAGTYGTGENRELGSPVLVAQFAKQIADERRAYQLRCINIEENPEWFVELELATGEFGYLVRNYQGAFVDHVDTIVSSMRGWRAVCFLDPFGIEGMDWAAIEKLIERGDHTDLVRVQATCWVCSG